MLMIKNHNVITYIFLYCSYCLLGASGCGKTTLLSTIVGLKKMDKGIVSIFGGIPEDRNIRISGKRIGYMPQVRQCP